MQIYLTFVANKFLCSCFYLNGGGQTTWHLLLKARFHQDLQCASVWQRIKAVKLINEEAAHFMADPIAGMSNTIDFRASSPVSCVSPFILLFGFDI